MRKLRLLLADDHAILLEGLTRLQEPEFEVTRTVEDGQALLKMSARLKPDVIIADISMPLLSGIEAIRQLRRTDSRTKLSFFRCTPMSSWRARQFGWALPAMC